MVERMGEVYCEPNQPFTAVLVEKLEDGLNHVGQDINDIVAIFGEFSILNESKAELERLGVFKVLVGEVDNPLPVSIDCTRVEENRAAVRLAWNEGTQPSRYTDLADRR